MRRDEQRLNDILEALDWIAKAVARRTETDFVADETLCYAVAQKLGVGQLRHLRRGVSQTGIRLPVAAKSAEGVLRAPQTTAITVRTKRHRSARARRQIGRAPCRERA